MSNWMSFYIHDSGKIALGDLRSHTRIAEIEGIDKKDTAWHRAEWTTENYDSLTIKVLNNPMEGITADELIDSMWKRWKNRSEFFKWAAPQLVELDCSHIGTIELPELPKCKMLYCSNNNLTKLPKLPECKVLYCGHNKLTELPELPKCKKLYCYYNNLTELPELPECKLLYYDSNKITALPELPKCEELHCYHNLIKEK